MSNTALYFTTVLIWGSTWYAITFQLGAADPAWSLVLRFAMAALILLSWCLWRRVPLKRTVSEQAWIAAQGLSLFCLNYLLFYQSTRYMASGLVAVCFSTVIVMNMINSALFLHKPFEGRIMVGALLGLVGISLVFWPEIERAMQSEQLPSVLRGVTLGLVATWLASIGNVISARNQMRGIPVLQGNAWGMLWGALMMFLWVSLSGVSMQIEVSVEYLVSLLYLALFGSVLAFGAYLSLIGRIGADRAAYAAVLFPLVALGISTVFEDYQWTWRAGLGVGLILAGNLFVLTPRASTDVA